MERKMKKDIGTEKSGFTVSCSVPGAIEAVYPDFVYVGVCLECFLQMCITIYEKFRPVKRAVRWQRGVL